jgi:hypothetical protein
MFRPALGDCLGMKRVRLPKSFPPSVGRFEQKLKGERLLTVEFVHYFPFGSLPFADNYLAQSPLI